MWLAHVTSGVTACVAGMAEPPPGVLLLRSLLVTSPPLSPSRPQLGPGSEGPGPCLPRCAGYQEEESVNSFSATTEKEERPDSVTKKRRPAPRAMPGRPGSRAE